MLPSTRTRSRFQAILTLRCPECREGFIFQSLWTTNERCPVCNLLFARETGYYTGAMYFSYALGIPIIALLTLAAWLVLPGWHLWQLVLVAWVLFLPLVPLVFRYSRALWIHFDRYFDPESDDDVPPPRPS